MGTRRISRRNTKALQSLGFYSDQPGRGMQEGTYMLRSHIPVSQGRPFLRRRAFDEVAAVSGTRAQQLGLAHDAHELRACTGLQAGSSGGAGRECGGVVGDVGLPVAWRA